MSSERLKYHYSGSPPNKMASSQPFVPKTASSGKSDSLKSNGGISIGGISLTLDNTDDKDDGRCGVGYFKPDWMQKFANIQSFVGMYAVCDLFGFALKIYLMSQVTTIEKRFGFSSSQSGFILSSSEISFLIFILIFPHYARKSHIPRLLSVASILCGITGLIFVLAHFLPTDDAIEVEIKRALNQTTHIQSRLKNSSHPSHICMFIESNNTTSQSEYNESESNECGEDSLEMKRSKTSNTAMLIFLGAMLLQGISNAPRTPLSGTYVDDNNPHPARTAKYIGVMVSIGAVAPLVAFGMGALSDNIYHTLEDTHMSTHDPRWIGAWWLGFLVCGIITILVSSFIFCFPRRMNMPADADHPKADIPRVNKSKVKHESSTKLSARETKLVSRIKALSSGIVRLLTNPVYMGAVFCQCLQMFGMVGTASFVPKYMETQFLVPAWKANIIMGTVAVLSMSIGPIIGGSIISKLKFTTLANLKLILTVVLISILSCPIAMIIAGEQSVIVKSSNPSRYSSQAFMYTNSSCMDNCLCSEDTMVPVCGTDGVTYFSPCHAGCFNQSQTNEYSQCTCINQGTARPGYCGGENPKVYAFAGFFFASVFAVTISVSSFYMIVLRTTSSSNFLRDSSRQHLYYMAGKLFWSRIMRFIQYRNLSNAVLWIVYGRPMSRLHLRSRCYLICRNRISNKDI